MSKNSDIATGDMGRAVPDVDQRRCLHPGCATILRRSNRLPFCGVHEHDGWRVGIRAAMLREYLPYWSLEKAPACVGMDTDRFFCEELSDGSLTGPIIEAKAVCWTCDFRADCAAWAFEHEHTPEGTEQAYREGIFGGATGPERHRFASRPDPVASLMAFLKEQARELPGITQQPRTVLYRSEQFWKEESSVA